MRRPSRREKADLAAFADGSIAPPRRERAERSLAESAELSQALARQRHALAAIRNLGDEPVPARLGQLATRPQLRPRVGRARRLRPAAVGTAILLCAAAAVTVVGLSGSPGSPTVVQAAAFGGLPATQPAPGRYDDEPNALARFVDGLAFPNLDRPFAWRAVGARTDRFTGRRAVTVFYAARDGREIAYTILGGSALPDPHGARTSVRNGVALTSFRAAGRQVVTWHRQGHSCVLSVVGSATVPVDRLMAVASWRRGGGRLY